MVVAFSVVLAVVGAILRYALTTTHWHGIDLPMLGLILIVVGIAGVVLGVVLWMTRRTGHRHVL